MNFGEKFPYALLTSPKKADCGINTHHTPPPNLVQAIISHISYSTPTAPEPHTPPQNTPQSKPICQYSTHPTPKHPAPTHYLTTPPIPLLLRVDSDEMWQKPVGFWLMRHWNARKGPRMGPKVHEVDSALARAQTKVDEVYGPYGSSPNPAEFAPSKFPQTLKYFRKPHKQ